MMIQMTMMLRADQEGVILLHGLARTSRSMERLADQLRAEGFTVVNVDYPSRVARIEVLSEQTITAALERRALQGCPKIHFVTHSMGGILLRQYLANHTEPRLGRVVMLAPPNQGSEVVDRIGSWKLFQWVNGPAGRELGTSSRALPNRLGRVEFECGVIAGDRSINGINSLMIPGRDDGKVSIARTRVEGMKDHLIVHATHPGIMKHPVAIQQTVRFLKTGSFESTSSQGRPTHCNHQ